MHGLAAVVRHGLEFITKWQWHFPVTTLVLVYSYFFNLPKQTVIARETRSVFAPCSLKDAVSSSFQDRVFNLKLVWAGYQLVALVSSLLVSLRSRGQASEAGEDMCGPAWEIEAHLRAVSKFSDFQQFRGVPTGQQLNFSGLV